MVWLEPAAALAHGDDALPYSGLAALALGEAVSECFSSDPRVVRLPKHETKGSVGGKEWWSVMSVCSRLQRCHEHAVFTPRLHRFFFASQIAFAMRVCTANIKKTQQHSVDATQWAMRHIRTYRRFHTHFQRVVSFSSFNEQYWWVDAERIESE
jgi:hypothetical protein